MRALITALLRVSTYANNLELDAGVALLQLQMGQAGVLYLDHGWQTMVDGLRVAAERDGARIELNASVEAIEQERGHDQRSAEGWPRADGVRRGRWLQHRISRLH